MSKLIGKGKYSIGDTVVLYLQGNPTKGKVVDLMIKERKSIGVREIRYLVQIVTWEDRPLYWIPEKYVYQHSPARSRVQQIILKIKRFFLM